MLKSQVSALLKAAQHGQLEKVQLIIETDPSLVNQTDSLGQTAILFAARKGYINIVQHLIKIGANLHGATTLKGSPLDGYNALDWAIAGKHDAVVKLLIQAGAITNALINDTYHLHEEAETEDFNQHKPSQSEALMANRPGTIFHKKPVVTRMLVEDKDNEFSCFNQW